MFNVQSSTFNPCSFLTYNSHVIRVYKNIRLIRSIRVRLNDFYVEFLHHVVDLVVVQPRRRLHRRHVNAQQDVENVVFCDHNTLMI